MQELINQAYEYGRTFIDCGEPATYIKELILKDTEKSGLALYDPNGNFYSAGDIDCRFTIQSIAKIISFLVLLESMSLEDIQKTVDMKPSALSYNSIMDLELAGGKARNPMNSLGAVAIIALLYQIHGEKTYDQILAKTQDLLDNRELDYQKEIFQAERSTAYNNTASLYLMVAQGWLEKDTPIEDIISTYSKICSIHVNTRELARFAYLLSHSGEDPKTDKRYFSEDHARILRTIMATSGMYEMSGEFALDVGLPAKSGVGGGLVAASKDGYGLASFSTKLDEAGNSIVGIKMLEYLSKKLHLSIY